MIFVSTFIDISNLIALFCMFIWRCHKEVFYVFVGAFHGYCLLSMQRQKRLVTVLFLQCSLLTSSETYLLQIDIWCFYIMSINSFSNTSMLAFWRSAFWFKTEVFSPNITFILFLWEQMSSPTKSFYYALNLFEFDSLDGISFKILRWSTNCNYNKRGIISSSTVLQLNSARCEKTEQYIYNWLQEKPII